MQREKCLLPSPRRLRRRKKSGRRSTERTEVSLSRLSSRVSPVWAGAKYLPAVLTSAGEEGTCFLQVPARASSLGSPEARGSPDCLPRGAGAGQGHARSKSAGQGRQKKTPGQNTFLNGRPPKAAGPDRRKGRSPAGGPARLPAKGVQTAGPRPQAPPGPPHAAVGPRMGQRLAVIAADATGDKSLANRLEGLRVKLQRSSSQHALHFAHPFWPPADYQLLAKLSWSLASIFAAQSGRKGTSGS